MQIARKIGAWQNALPYKAQVEYIESSGTQWIDTGIVPNFNTEVRFRGTMYEAVNGSILVGTRTGSDNYSRFFVFGYDSTSSTRSLIGVSQYTNDFTYDSTLHDVIFNTNDSHQLWIDNNYVHTFPSGNEVTEQNGLCLFGTLGYGSSHYCTKGIIAYCKIYDSGTLVLDLIPVLDLDGNYKMFDLVTQSYPAHYGTFTGGGCYRCITSNKWLQGRFSWLSRHSTQSLREVA